MAPFKHVLMDESTPEGVKRLKTESKTTESPTNSLLSASTVSLFAPVSDGKRQEKQLEEQQQVKASVLDDLYGAEVVQQESSAILSHGDNILKAFWEQCPPKFKRQLQEFLGTAHTTIHATVEKRFAEFQHHEPSLSHGAPHHLIKPSRPLMAPVIIKLHNPSFTTRFPDNGSVYDLSSPCPTLLARSGFSDQNALWLEASWRRETAPRNRASPMKQYTDELRSVHEKFTQWCETHSSAKVVLVCGSHNHKDLSQKHPEVKYWTLYLDDVSVKLGITSNVIGSIDRIHVCACHPEYLFRNGSVQVAKTFDLALGVAAAVTRIEGFNYGFFERRDRYFASDDFVSKGEDDGAFHVGLSLHETAVPQTFDDLSQTMLSWLQVNASIVSKEDFEKRCAGKDVAAFIHGLLVAKGGRAKRDKEKAMGLAMPSGLDKVIQNKRNKKTILNSRITNEGPLSVVRVKCMKCNGSKSERDDTRPDWEITTMKYVLRTNTSCPNCGVWYVSKGLKPQRRRRATMFGPVDRTLRFVDASKLRI